MWRMRAETGDVRGVADGLALCVGDRSTPSVSSVPTAHREGRSVLDGAPADARRWEGGRFVSVEDVGGKGRRACMPLVAPCVWATGVGDRSYHPPPLPPPCARTPFASL